MYLKACLNGVRRKDQHLAIPCTAEEIAADAAACRDAGAAAVHVHAKDVQGFDSLLASAVDPVVAALRARCPGLPVGVTTGAWAMADPAARCAAINGWSELPDVASVNWHEEGAAEVRRGVAEPRRRRGGGAVERGGGAGVVELAAAQGLLPRPARAAGRRRRHRSRGAGHADADAGSDIRCRRRAAARGGLVGMADARRRGSARCGGADWIGLEDTLRLPEGTTAASNAELVAAGHGRIRTATTREVC